MITPITEEWLKANGFLYHQLDRQPDKHWLLWLGGAMPDKMTSYEDLGIELAPTLDGKWFCWLRADSSHRYSRFLHVRHLSATRDVVELISALVGAPFDPSNCSGGHLRTSEDQARIAKLQERMDQKMLIETPAYLAWHPVEADRYAGGPLHEHQRAYLDARRNPRRTPL